jgi:hypothetical protein
VLGLRTSLSLQQPTGAFTHTYAYDAAKRLSTLTAAAGTFTYKYSAGVGAVTISSDQIKSLILPTTGPAYITNFYDSVGRLTDTWLKHNGGTVLSSNSYTYNAAHQRLKHIRTDQSHVGFSYDKIGQLESAYATNAAGGS